MSEPRTFSVCQGCGAWKETASDLESFFADYDMAFFVEHHKARCPVTGKPEVLACIREDDPNYSPLPPEKQWRPESCPGYKPPQEPTFRRYATDVRDRLIGLWVTSNPGGHSGETLVLLPDGTGALDFYNIVFCCRRPLRWRLQGEEHIRVDGEDGYFRTEEPYFEVGCFTNMRGDETDMIRIFDRGIQSQPTEFFRSKESLNDYRIPENVDG